jgi:hypothetical protein
METVKAVSGQREDGFHFREKRRANVSGTCSNRTKAASPERDEKKNHRSYPVVFHEGTVFY